MTHRSGVRRGEEGRVGFSAQLAYMIHLTELSSLHCNKYLPTPHSVSVSVFRVKAVGAVDQHNTLNKNKYVSLAPHVVLHQGSGCGYDRT